METNVMLADRATCKMYRLCHNQWRWLLVGALLISLLSGCTPFRKVRADLAIDRADDRMSQNDLNAALVELQRAVELDPQLAVAHSKLGTVYRRLGRYEDAIDSFVQAVQRNPFSFDDTVNLAQLYYMTQRVRDAVQAYLHAVQLKPDDFDSQLNLGVCYQRMGDLEQAVQRFRMAITLDPNQPYAYVNLGVALDAQGKYYEAVRAYKEALERDSKQPLVLINLANTYMKQDRLKIAQQTLLTALEIDPSLAAAHEALGYCRFRLRDFEGAETSYRDAVVLNPRLPRSYAGLGSIYMLRHIEKPEDTDLRDRAVEMWHRSLEMEPDQPRIRKLLARYQTEKATNPEAILLEEKYGG